MTVFERALARAGYSARFTEGYNPKPRLEFANPLSLGLSSEEEIAGIDIHDFDTEADFISRMNRSLPDGLRVLRGEIAPDAGPARRRSLMSLYWGADFEVTDAAGQVTTLRLPSTGLSIRKTMLAAGTWATCSRQAACHVGRGPRPGTGQLLRRAVRSIARRSTAASSPASCRRRGLLGLDLIPQLVHPLETRLGGGHPRGGKPALHLAEAALELRVRAVQRKSRVHVEGPRQVDHREEEIPELFLGLCARPAVHGGAKLADLLVDLLPRPARRSASRIPTLAALLCSFAALSRARERSRHAVQG